MYKGGTNTNDVIFNFIKNILNLSHHVLIDKSQTPTVFILEIDFIVHVVTHDDIHGKPCVVVPNVNIRLLVTAELMYINRAANINRESLNSPGDRATAPKCLNAVDKTHNTRFIYCMFNIFNMRSTYIKKELFKPT
jgi:hypothetical protein